MNQYFALIPSGPPFRLFSTEHLLALLVFLAINLGIAASVRGGRNPQLAEAIRWVLIAQAIVDQIAWNWWQASVGIWTIADSLPLQICTLSEALCTIMLLTRGRRLYGLLYFWCLAGAGNGLITPDLVAYSFPHARYWIFFSAHGANVTAIVFMTVAYGYRPQWSTLWKTALATNIYLAAIMVVNAITGGNYMYVARKPDFPTLMDAMGPWPWYILGLELAGIISFVLVYAPFALRDRLATRRPAHLPRAAP